MNVIIIVDKEKKVIECPFENFIDDVCDKFTKKISVKKKKWYFFKEEKKITKNIKTYKFIKKMN